MTHGWPHTLVETSVSGHYLVIVVTTVYYCATLDPAPQDLSFSCSGMDLITCLLLIFVDLHNLLPILNLLQGCEKLVFELFSSLCSTCHKILKFILSV